MMGLMHRECLHILHALTHKQIGIAHLGVVVNPLE